MKIALVCSHGGHLTEMLELVDAFEGHDLFFVTYKSTRAVELAQRYNDIHHEQYGYQPPQAGR